MPLGILEPRRLGGDLEVPGTVVLQADDYATVVRNPEPSTSPNDPFLWPLKKKLIILLIISLGCLGAGLQGISLSVATLPIVEEFHITIEQAESLTSYPFLSTGVSCACCAIISRLVGKRPIYLFGGICGLIGVIWSSVATTYGSFVGARIIYGLSAGVFESLPLATIGDIFFLHQRGRSTATYSFICLGFTQLSPVLGGYVTERDGWRTQFHIMIAYWAIVLLLLIFANPETTFTRDSAILSNSASSKMGQETNVRMNSPLKSSQQLSIEEMPISYLQTLLPFQHIKDRPTMFHAILGYAITGLYPIVWIAFLILGTFQAWWIGISLSLAQIFGGPPTNFGPTKLGFLNVFGIVGALGAQVMLYSLSDSSCRRLSRANKNTHEPEYRLIMILPAVLATAIGFPLFGYYAGTVAQTREISWPAAAFLFGITLFCLVTAQSVSLSYLLDSHRDISVEATMFVIMLRGFWTYGAGTFLPRWIQHSGVAHAFYEIAGLQVGLILLLACSTYIFGKRIRWFTHRYSPMKKWLYIR